jgi:CheY-like chemotaxis protein
MPGTILVVEDNAMNMRLMADLLGHYGYEVLEAGNGLQAMMLVHQHHVDLILMDMQMPIMNGFECVQMLHANEKTAGIKIVAVTSLAMDEDKARILETGVDELITKPIDTREFPNIIKQLLEQKPN